MSREIMQQAFDALNTCDWDYDYDEESYKTFDKDLVNAAAAALEAELAKPEQEPVAYMGSAGFGYDKNKYLSIPLYTAPPRKPWVGLTDDEVFEFLSDGVDGREDINNIEEALRSKNT